MGRALLVLEGPHERQKAISWINKAPVGTRVEFKASKRSLPQNDMMWALLTEVAQQLEHGGNKYDPAQWKAIFLHAFGREISFLPSLDLKTFLPIELSSSDLSKDEMTNLIEFILKEGTERGVVFHTPTDSNPGEDASLPVTDESEANTASSVEPSDQTVSPDAGSTDEEPATISSVPAHETGSSSLIPEKEIAVLRKFAKDALNTAKTMPPDEGMKKVINRWLNGELVNVASDDGKAAIKSIRLSVAAIMRNDGEVDFDVVISEQANGLGCSIEELGGAS